MDVFFRGEKISGSIIYLIDPIVDIKSFIEDIVVPGREVYFFDYRLMKVPILFPGQSSAFEPCTALTFRVFGDSVFTISIFINGDVYVPGYYHFRSEFYESPEFEKISYKEFDNYIECLAVGITLGSEYDILESMVRYILKNTQYLFDKYGRADGLSFPVSLPYAYRNLIFSLDDEKGYIRVEMQEKGSFSKVFLCAFKLVGASIDFLKYFSYYEKCDCISIVNKNSTPSIEGGNNQYYSKAEIDLKLNEIKLLIRNISTLPEGSSNSILTLDTQQFKALSSLLLLGGK